jgi:uncharacterized protein (TIGR00288 family)
VNRDRVMLLIDADNVSIDIIEQAVAWVREHHGGPHVRRAYCTAESAVKHQAVFKRLSIRPMVNLAAGKNSTDIALAVDAVDLATAEQPDVVVIASSDSDFAPLVTRLREKGSRVIGIGQEGKIGEETAALYDDYATLSHRKAAARPSRLTRPTRPTGPTTPTATAAAAPTAPVNKEKAPARKRSPARKTDSNADTKAEPVPDKVIALMQALPALARGESMELNVVAARLRELKLLSRSGSTTKVFGEFPAWFDLQPPQQPSRVRALRPIAQPSAR